MLRNETDPTVRAFVTISLGSVALFQAHIYYTSFKYVPALGSALEGIGAEIPAVTLFYLKTQVFWVLIPLFYFLATIYIGLKKKIKPLASSILFATGILLFYTMQHIAITAPLAPLVEISNPF